VASIDIGTMGLSPGRRMGRRSRSMLVWLPGARLIALSFLCTGSTIAAVPERASILRSDNTSVAPPALTIRSLKEADTESMSMALRVNSSMWSLISTVGSIRGAFVTHDKRRAIQQASRRYDVFSLVFTDINLCASLD
jgi:hypothetical protein